MSLSSKILHCVQDDSKRSRPTSVIPAKAIAEALYDSLEAKIDNLVTKDLLKAELSALKLELILEMETHEKRLARLVVASLSLFTIILGLFQHFHI